MDSPGSLSSGPTPAAVRCWSWDSVLPAACTPFRLGSARPEPPPAPSEPRPLFYRALCRRCRLSVLPRSTLPSASAEPSTNSLQREAAETDVPLPALFSRALRLADRPAPPASPSLPRCGLPPQEYSRALRPVVSLPGSLLRRPSEEPLVGLLRASGQSTSGSGRYRHRRAAPCRMAFAVSSCP